MSIFRVFFKKKALCRGLIMLFFAFQFFCRFLKKIALNICLITLVILGLFQCAYCGTEYYKWRWPLPDFVEKKLVDWFDQKGYVYYARSFHVSLFFKFELDELSIARAETGGSHMAIRHVVGYLNPFFLLFGKVNVREVQVEGLSYQLKHTKNKALNQVSGRFKMHGNQLDIDYLKGFFTGVPFLLKGQWALDVLSLSKSSADFDIADLLSYLNATKGLFLKGQLNYFSKEKSQVCLCVLADEWHGAHNLRLKNVFGRIESRLDNALPFRHQAYVSIGESACSYFLKLNNATIWLKAALGENFTESKIDCVHILTDKVYFKEGVLDGSETLLSLSSKDHWGFNTLLVAGDNHGYCKGHYDRVQKQIKSSFSIDLKDGLNKSPIFKEHPALNEGRFSNIQLHGEGAWSFVDNVFDIVVLGFLKAFDWRNLSFDRLSFKIGLQPHHLIIQRCLGKVPTGFFELIGHLQKTGVSRLQVLGQLDPTLLNAYLPDWWKSIWPPIVFANIWPRADLDIYCDFNDVGPIRVIGLIEGYDFSYYHEWINQFKTHLYAKNQDVQLGPFVIGVGEARGLGDIRWLFDPAYNEPIATFLTYEGNLPFNTLKSFQAAKKFLNWFDCPIPPVLKLSGASYLLESDKDYLLLKAESSASLRYWGVVLDNLYFQAKQTGALMAIAPINFGFCGGQGTARATVDNCRRDDSLLQLTVSVQDVQKNQLSENVPQLSDFRSLISKNELNTAGQSTGVIDGHFSGYCPLGNIFGLEGEGYFYLQSFRKMGFLGASDLLKRQSTDIKNDFEIREISTGFRIKNNFLYVEDARLSGPTTRIIANGSYHLLNHLLDVRLRFLPFAEVPLIATAFLPLRPLSKFFEMRLTGSLENPRWSFNNF
jgi:hypothetical protein